MPDVPQRCGLTLEVNRRADETVTEDQAAYRRVRLTARLGHRAGSFDHLIRP
jgi:hypothetical protein